MKNFISTTLACTLACLAAGLAQNARAGETFGIVPGASTYIPAIDFHSVSSGTCSMNELGSGYFLQTTGCGSDVYLASLEIPEGARITGYSPMFYDNDANDHIQTGILRSFANAFGGGSSGYLAVGSSAYLSTGASAAFQSPTVAVGTGGAGHVFDSYDHVAQRHFGYFFYVVMPPATEVDIAFRGVWVYWQRQIAPAPASASFADVPTSHPFFNEIEQLAKSNITLGCGGGNYCPDASVTRGQMAAFLGRALGLSWDFETNAP